MCARQNNADATTTVIANICGLTKCIELFSRCVSYETQNM